MGEIDQGGAAGTRGASRWRAVTVLLLLSALLPRGGTAQGSVTDGDATFSYGGFATDACGSDRVDFVPGTVGGAPDVAWAIWWWVGVGGQAESPLPAPSAQGYDGATATLDFEALNGVTGLTARLIGTVSDGAEDNQATWFEQLTITNATGAPVELDIVHYADIEAGGTFGSDEAVNPDPLDSSWIRVTDPAVPEFFEDYRAAQPDAFAVSPYSSLCSLLQDALPTDLDNAGLPFGPGDFTAAFEWRGRLLEDGTSIDLLTAVGIDEPTLPGLIFQDGFESEDTSRWSLQTPP